MPSTNTIRMCAAGSGKTWGICNDALGNVAATPSGKRVLITTYTNKGVDTVNGELAKQNLGVTSQKITVCSWYQFLMAELIRPYQSIIVGINQIRAFDFSDRYGQVNYGRKGQARRYFSGRQKYVMKDYASELAVFLIENSEGAVIDRLASIYSHIYIDEMQDMAGYDMTILDLLFDSNVSVICVGDNKQATYRTHNTKNRKGQSGKNLWEYCADKNERGLVIIEKSLVSRRFNRSICAFANSVYPNENNISTSMTEVSGHDGVFLIARSDVRHYCDYFTPIILKYDAKTDTGEIPSFNFGQCKGMTFERVVIYPNKPLLDFLTGTGLKSPEKYYVAVTRSKYSIAIVVDELISNDFFKIDKVQLGDMEIQASVFINTANDNAGSDGTMQIAE